MARRTLTFALVLGLALASPGAGVSTMPVGEPGNIDAIPIGPSPQERIEEIRRKVQAALVYPPPARRRGISGTTQIQFEVGSDGHPLGLLTVASSGSPMLDRAAERSARDAAPLPFVYGRLRIPVVFSLKTSD